MNPDQEFFASEWDDEECLFHQLCNGWIKDCIEPSEEEPIAIVEWWLPLNYTSEVLAHGWAICDWEGVSVDCAWMLDNWPNPPEDMYELFQRLGKLPLLPAYAWPAEAKQKQFDLDWWRENATPGEIMRYFHGSHGCPPEELARDLRRNRIRRLAS